MNVSLMFIFSGNFKFKTRLLIQVLQCDRSKRVTTHERNVTSRYQGSKISGSQKSLILDRDGHLHCRTMEET